MLRISSPTEVGRRPTSLRWVLSTLHAQPDLLSPCLGVLCFGSLRFAGDERAHAACGLRRQRHEDRKSTRLNSSHLVISYAVFCLKKKKTRRNTAAAPR